MAATNNPRGYSSRVPHLKENLLFGPLSAVVRQVTRDSLKLASTAITSGPEAAWASAQLAVRRRRSLDPPVPPDSPLSWQGTLDKIQRHYSLLDQGLVMWGETEARADVRRIVALSLGFDPSPSGPHVVVREPNELRRVLATIETLRSWPASRHLGIYVVRPTSLMAEPWPTLLSIPGLEFLDDVASAPSRLEIEAGALPLPHWAEIRVQRQEILAEARQHNENRGARDERLLVLTELVPDSRRGSGSQDIYWFARHSVALGFDVLLLPTEPRPHDSNARWDLRRVGVSVPSGAVSRRQTEKSLPAAIRKCDIVVAFEPELAIKARQVISGCGGTQRLLFVPLDLRQFPLQALMDANMQHQLAEFGSAVPSQEAVRSVEQIELAAMRASDRTALLSLDEINALAGSAVADKLMHLPMLRSEAIWVHSPAARPRVVFVGGFRHPPNYVAARWFIDRVWPAVVAALPWARLEVYGADLDPNWAKRWSEAVGVIIKGSFESDSDPYLGDVIAVAPLLYGGGTKGKVVTALGHGGVVIGTRFAIQGLPKDVQSAVALADSAEEFVSTLIDLLQDPSRRQHLRESGRDAYHRWFSPEVGFEKVRAVVGGLRGSA